MCNKCKKQDSDLHFVLNLNTMPEELGGKLCIALLCFDLSNIFPIFSLFPKIEYSPEIAAAARTIVLQCNMVQ